MCATEPSFGTKYQWRVRSHRGGSMTDQERIRHPAIADANENHQYILICAARHDEKMAITPCRYAKHHFNLARQRKPKICNSDGVWLVGAGASCVLASSITRVG